MNVIIEKAMSLWSCSGKASHVPSTASKFGEFDDDLRVEALPDYGAVPNLPMNMDNVWFAAVRLPRFSVPCRGFGQV